MTQKSAIAVKLIIIIAIAFFPLSISLGQNSKDISVSRTKLTGDQFILSIKKNDKLIYLGNFDLPQALPTGTHFLFSEKGSIKKIFKYSFSKNQFEGIPNVIQTTYEFDATPTLRSIKVAERCTECEYTPVGIWRFFNEKSVLIKSVNAAMAKLEHPEYEDYWKWISENGL